MKRKAFFSAALAFCAAAANAPRAEASFERQNWGVHAAGMGGAFAALAEDGNALFWNPAGTGFMRGAEASFMWERPYPELEGVSVASGFTSLVVPTRHGSFGGAITHFKIGGLLQENMGFLHYAHRWGTRWSTGLNLKFLTHDFPIGNDPAFATNPVFANGTGKSAVTADLGALYRASERFSLGFAGRNVTEPNVGLVDEDEVPSEYQAGLAWHPLKGMTLELDGLYRNQQEGNASDRLNVMAGVERWFFRENSIGTRLGYNIDEISAGLSLHPWAQSRMNFRLDYAFSLNLELLSDDPGTHKIAVSLLFGGGIPSHASVALASSPLVYGPLPTPQKTRELAPEVPAQMLVQSPMPSPIPPPAPVKVALFLGAKGATAAEASAARAAIKEELGKSRRYAVLDKAKLEKVIAEQAAQLNSYSTRNRLLKIAELLNASKVVAATLSKDGTNHAWNLEWIEVSTGQVLLSEMARFAAGKQNIADAAGGCARKLAAKLFADTSKPPAKQPGGPALSRPKLSK